VNLALLLWLGLRLDGYVAAPLRKHLNLEQTQGIMIDLKSLMGLINSVLQIWCDKHSCRQPAVVEVQAYYLVICGGSMLHVHSDCRCVHGPEVAEPGQVDGSDVRVLRINSMCCYQS
jgi:hypothetical protein